MSGNHDQTAKSGGAEAPKRKRGRKPTGHAMTPAEKQRAYRERLKKRNVTELKQRETKLQYLTRRNSELADMVEALKLELAAARKGRSKDLSRWEVQSKDKGAVSWVTIGEQLTDSYGDPLGLPRVKLIVQNHLRSAKGTGIKFRAINEEGLIYEPKLLK